MANNQSVRRHLDALTRGRIIGKLEEGRSVTSVAAEFGIAHSIVSRVWKQFQTKLTAIRGFSIGRPRGTTPADDRYIVLQARRNRRQTAGEIARHTTQATGRLISRFTVARRLHGGGLFARRPVRCVPLTPAHRRRRSLWCREHRNWRDNEWGRILFTDESRFSLSSDSHHILIWRERGSRNHPSNIIERDRYGGSGVLVWGGIMLGSRTDLHIFDAGSVNGTRYCNEILLPYVRLFRGAMGLQFLFMDDNAPCHRTVAAEQLLESRRLAARTLPPVTIREIRLALQDEWAAMPQLIDTLILSMRIRCETCLAVRGIISPTKDRMFLAGHTSQGCLGLQSHCAPCYFFNQASFTPLISLLDLCIKRRATQQLYTHLYPKSPTPNHASFANLHQRLFNSRFFVVCTQEHELIVRTPHNEKTGSDLVSTLLNLSKISNCQAEMDYITKMRNLILFQLSSSKEFQYLDGRFHQQIWVHNRSLPIFRICYSHAFFQIVKSHVLVHNYEPFRHWDIIVTDNDGHPQERKVETERNVEAIPINRILVADNGLACPSSPNWNFYPYYKEIITGIQSNVFEQFYADSFLLKHESTWRRVYAANLTFFFCGYSDFSLYVMEQKLDKTPINVFKTILGREIGMCFNQKSVLKTIASPYYYILPYQDKRKYAIFERKVFHSSTPVPDLTTFELVCQLEMAVKKL
ncbi:transposable element Tcb2 transposase [Trichonephila clavipes]|nr:transposable element Tcb2 transposase [Trichonephila clavipes]